MLVNVVGLGYIGLPTALMLARGGINVLGTDINKSVIESLNNGTLEFKEERYEEVYQSAKENGIFFSDKCGKAQVYIIAVSTPYIKNTKKIDVTYVITALEDILNICDTESIIVIESTISPGTIDKYVRDRIHDYEIRTGNRIHIAHAPERIIPGNMFYELENNARVIGVDSRAVGEILKNLYISFCKSEIIITDIKTAEMTKVVENTYRDINIAFANELTKICKEGNMNVYEVIRIANMHPRVNILQPGPGVGGHCISVDPWFLVGDYPGLANIILAARKINDSMPKYVLRRINEIMKENDLADTSRIGFYGLTYKEDVDDIRESPTLQLIERMRMHLAAAPKVYDPMIYNKIVDNQYLNFEEFIRDIDLMVIMVGHSHLKNKLDSVKEKVLLDTKKLDINSDGKVYYL